MTTPSQPAMLERHLATVLQAGTILATTLLGLAILAEVADIDATLSLPGTDLQADLMSIGIVCFILLPVLRVVVMFRAYLRNRDHGLATFAGLVLAIIAAGMLAGLIWTT